MVSRERPVGCCQNVVGPTPLLKLDGVSSNFQQMFLRVLSFTPDKTFDCKRSVRRQGCLVDRVLGSCYSVPGLIPAWEFDLMGLLIYRLEYLLSYWTALSSCVGYMMLPLALMSVCFLDIGGVA